MTFWNVFYLFHTLNYVLHNMGTYPIQCFWTLIHSFVGQRCLCRERRGEGGEILGTHVAPGSEAVAVAVVVVVALTAAQSAVLAVRNVPAAVDWRPQLQGYLQLFLHNCGHDDVAAAVDEGATTATTSVTSYSGNGGNIILHHHSSDLIWLDNVNTDVKHRIIAAVSHIIDVLVVIAVEVSLVRHIAGICPSQLLNLVIQISITN